MNTHTRFVNIAIVGHVANGKTTIVERLSGIYTKKDSSEQKSGRTIKLGYANCIVWKCRICDNISTSGQNDTINCCSIESDPVQHISFVDAPGHHDYVATAVKGVASVDCAIIVTDVQKDSLQPQTLEHLAILDVYNVQNVIIVQNKIDLVPEEKYKEACENNYKMLKKEFERTVAEDAPIIPLSAESGLGLQNLQRHIYIMVQRFLQNHIPSNSKVFSIIRSFDINRPNTKPEDTKGGVIGGTVKGDCKYKVGDTIEIRPSPISEPLYTKIVSIFSEQQECQEVKEGGLYGIGTTVHPKIAQRDKLAGCIAGKSEDLPKVVSTVVMKVRKIKLDESEIKPVKDGKKVNLIIGSITVDATAKKNVNGTFTMKLVKPICTVERKCLIYDKEDKRLISFGVLDFLNPMVENKIKTFFSGIDEITSEIFSSSMFSDEDIREIRAFPSQISAHTIGEELDTMFNSCTTFSRKFVGDNILLFLYGHQREKKTFQSNEEYTEILTCVAPVKIDRSKTVLPVPDLIKENVNAVWRNYELFCTIVHRDVDMVSKFISEELQLSVSKCDDGLRISDGAKYRLTSHRLENILRSFAKNKVACKQCKTLDTTLQKKGTVKVYEICCNRCHSRSPIV